MPIEMASWSTTKFVLIAFAAAFATAFVLNGVLNELLHLGVPSGSFGAAIGVVVALMFVHWTRVRAAAKKQE